MLNSQVIAAARRTRRGKGFRGFSLIELVIVVVIIGIIGAIAIPRISRGASGAADSALTANLAVLRNAIDLYATEHSGTFPTLLNISTQLTQYTDASGGTAASKDTTHIYGPYLRSIPALPVGAEKGSTAFTDTLGTEDCAWVYNATEGTVKANTAIAEKDAAGKLYSDY
ncbi:MAG: prepilin-type N-terminal cleavage/methylation domain-containing protein [Phycisphaeraceae bacterium]|nr:prepilin-type N-terminal cleavage/methylation domain-containing protein [Phycisphaeraceae bacterium]